MDAGLKTLGDAVDAAQSAGQPEWLWRALELRGNVHTQAGRTLAGRKDHEQALIALEEIATRLPPDLREVYWNDPSRRRVRELSDPLARPAQPLPHQLGRLPRTGAISTMTVTPLEQRLARILEINAELAGTVDLPQLAGRIVDNAIALLKAERGYLLLVDARGKLVVHTSRLRDREQANTDFSESIARSVLRQKEPIVSLNAASDVRFEGFSSVHQLMLKSVACVPVRAPSGEAIGALYLETRTRPGRHFNEELPTLAAFSDQAAVALENARLISENLKKSDELSRTNDALQKAKDELEEALGERTRRLKVTRRRLRDAQATIHSHFGYRQLVGTSEAMRRLYALIERVKDTDLPVLITGESGTGKEVVARVIHDASPRSARKFLGVNCGAIPEHLLESELFGHKRGAFTGADRDRKGLFREAEEGTILLDEVGETPQRMQTGLLRVLQEKKVRAVGATDEVEVDVRVLFATNRDLKSLVEEGRFREDLFYRIHVVELRLPSLRERTEDIPQLVDHFLGLFAARFKREKKVVSREGLRALSHYDWPGNVRQLENVLLNAWVLSDGEEIEVADLEVPNTTPASAPAVAVAAEAGREAGSGSRRETASQHGRDERDRIVEALRACNWNRVRAAELSGIPRRTFYRRLRKYGIL
jgi:transcriptional regulator with GAF, ATPase, and Fis domain